MEVLSAAPNANPDYKFSNLALPIVQMYMELKNEIQFHCLSQNEGWRIMCVCVLPLPHPFKKEKERKIYATISCAGLTQIPLAF